MTETSTPAAPIFDIFANATGTKVHLVDARNGGAFICGTPAGRSRWACQAVNIPFVGESFACSGCVEKMHELRAAHAAVVFAADDAARA